MLCGRWSRSSYGILFSLLTCVKKNSVMTDSDLMVLEDALKILQKKSDALGQIKILIQLGQIYQSNRQYQKALIYSRRALDLAKDQSNPDYRIAALVNRGCVYWEMSQLKKAIGFFQDALPITKELGDDVGRRMLYAIMGISYWRKGEWPRAMDWFEKALQDCPAGEIKNNTLQSIDPWKYEGLKIVMERGVETLKNRIQIAKNQNDPVRILLPSFSIVPLMFFTGQKEQIPHLLQTIIPLARQLKKNNILDVILTFKKITGVG